jgi:methyl-accepting chemotaxis protein
MHSIRNHQNSATQVIKANNEIGGIVVQISDASLLQAGNSQQIGESLNDFEESTKVHVTSTMVMDEVLVKLARQIDVLQKEMERFKVQA